MTVQHETEIQARVVEVGALLDRQHAALDELEAWSRRQRVLVEAGDGEGLLDLLRVRGELIERAEAGSATLARLRAQMEATPPGREALRTLAERFLAIEAMAGRVADRDREDEASLRAHMSRIAGELAELAMGRRALGAYGPGANAAGPRFQDRKG